MTGLTGGVVTGESLESMVDSMWDEPWYEATILEAGDFGIGHLHHGSKDPLGHSVVRSGRTRGVVGGAIANRNELGLEMNELIERVVDDPVDVLPSLEGPFAIAAFDTSERSFVLATDKLGSRPVYYTSTPDFRFGSTLASLLVHADDPTIDEQAISDLLLIGHMWGDETLLEGVSSLRPASVLEYEDGQLTTTRYWKPSYDPEPAGDEYVFELAKRFQGSVDSVAETIPAVAGLWLSGGLDSRMTASELARSIDDGARPDRLVTYTYDFNPPGGVNPEVAERVASTLDVPNVSVDFSIDQFTSVLEDAVEITDGMVQWNTLFNLSSVFNLQQPEANVVMEGLEGSLVGHHLYPYHFQCDSAVDAMYRSEASRDVETVRRVLAIDADPLASFRTEVEESPESTHRGVILDAHYQNYYARLALASNRIPRTQIGTRVPYVDGAFIQQSARLPISYREKSVPFTDGGIPLGVPKAKLKMVRFLTTELSDIMYERTSLPPRYPLPAQVAGFVGTTAYRRLLSKNGYGGPGFLDEAYRDHAGFRQRIDGLLDAACDRRFFDEGAIRELQDEHLAGDGNHVSKFAPVTTLEIWLQRHLD